MSNDGDWNRKKTIATPTHCRLIIETFLRHYSKQRFPDATLPSHLFQHFQVDALWSQLRDINSPPLLRSPTKRTCLHIIMLSCTVFLHLNPCLKHQTGNIIYITLSASGLFHFFELSFIIVCKNSVSYIAINQTPKFPAEFQNKFSNRRIQLI